MNISQGPHHIDDPLTFTVVTHRGDTFALTDADSVPSYRIYEDETGTAILTGSMAKLDDTNTTGFYSEQITLSAANGFEVGKTYSIYVTATVNSVTGGDTASFKIRDLAFEGVTAYGTAQAATATTLQLKAAETFADDTPIGSTLFAFGSTQGYWQAQVITDYVLSTDTATVPGWTVTPSGTIRYIVFGSAAGQGVAQTGDAFARIGALGAGLTGIPWNAAWDAEVQSEVADALEATIADSIPADGTIPSVKQALYMLTQFMLERSVSATTVTIKKPDGSTTLFTLTLNDGTSPTSITRAT